MEENAASGPPRGSSASSPAETTKKPNPDGAQPTVYRISIPPVAGPLGRARLSTTQASIAPDAKVKWGLTLAALGVVFGDIGTSPLYAFKECLRVMQGVRPPQELVLGICSLMFWALTAVVSIKYIAFIMRADNHGEGGILALLALTPQASRNNGSRKNYLVMLVLFGSALLYGDGAITPAISVLSAVEGLNIATHYAEPYVVPITIAILIVFFVMQRRGTADIGRLFGPIMLVWFVTIAVLGVSAIIKSPEVLAAVSPVHAWRLLAETGWHGFVVLGAVVLCITGGEALYADMGHFGRKPIALGWYSMVMPALLLNYFGQGALVLHSTEAPDNTFYDLVPRALLYPMVALSTMAAIIASQALVSGAYSLTRQAVQLGYWPRVTIVHTSKDQEGQIYVPEINWILMVVCVYLVLDFGSSSNLASAYGIAVTGTMLITSVVYYVVITRTWGWSLWRALPVVAFFLIIDIAFFGANALKFMEGGWVPILMALVVFIVMTTWKLGRRRVMTQLAETRQPFGEFLTMLKQKRPPRVPGTAVFLSADPLETPPAMEHHFRHNQALHEKVIVLTILNEPVPFVPMSSRITVRYLTSGIYQVLARYGFMESPNVPKVLESCVNLGLEADPDTATFYLGSETIVSASREGIARWKKVLYALFTSGPQAATRLWRFEGLPRWRKALFIFLSRNSRSATSYFGIPPDRVVELGMQVEI